MHLSVVDKQVASVSRPISYHHNVLVAAVFNLAGSQ